MSRTVALDLGGTHVSAGRVDLDHARVDESVRIALPPTADRDELLDRIIGAATRVAVDVDAVGVAARAVRLRQRRLLARTQAGCAVRRRPAIAPRSWVRATRARSAFPQRCGCVRAWRVVGRCGKGGPEGRGGDAGDWAGQCVPGRREIVHDGPGVPSAGRSTASRTAAPRSRRRSPGPR